MAKKKKKPRGAFFVVGDPRAQLGGRPTREPPSDSPSPPKFREPKSVFENVAAQVGGIPPGSTLRPFDDSKDKLQKSEFSFDSQNWLIDESKMFEATNDALKCHDNSKNQRSHTAKLMKNETKKLGLGVQVSFSCGFKNCRFRSKMYELYTKTDSGQPLANLQLGVAMSKTDLTAKTIETLATTLNLDPPTLGTLHKAHNKALECTEELAEQALTDNRKEVTTTLRLRGELEANEIPSVDCAIDGQYSNRSYHCPSGKSDSVSVPVVENVTGKGLIIQHINLSHRDGSLPSDTHINSGETLAASANYEKTYLAPNYPLHFGVVTTDGDTGLVKALEKGRIAVGESRPLKRRGCIFHAESAAKRKFTRESLVKLTPTQKVQMEQSKTFPLSSDLEPNACAACNKTFKSIKGLNIHRRSCKGERAEECMIKGLEPLFMTWENKIPPVKLPVKDKKLWRDAIRRWLLKRIKAELNLGIHAFNPHNINLKNDAPMRESLYLAGKTVVKCLSGDHVTCLTDARGCGGPESPPDYDFLPSKSSLGPIPSQTFAWLTSINDLILSREALGSLVVNGKKSTTSLVESAHKEIRLPIPKGRIYRKNESRLIKSGN